ALHQDCGAGSRQPPRGRSGRDPERSARCIRPRREIPCLSSRQSSRSSRPTWRRRRLPYSLQRTRHSYLFSPLPFPYRFRSWHSSRCARRNGAPIPAVADASCDRRAHERLDSHSHTGFRLATAPLEWERGAVAGGCGHRSSVPTLGAMDEETTVTVNDIPEGATIVDVREDDEWEAGHIEGAYHVPLGELPARLDDLPLDDDMYVICRTGGRSNRAVAWLNQNGFDAFNVQGGMGSWNLDNGKPIVSETGEEP